LVAYAFEEQYRTNMISIFKILPNDIWEEALITGIIPRTKDDHDELGVSVYRHEDLIEVCRSLYKKNEFPIALELAADSYIENIEWQKPSATESLSIGRVSVSNLMADLVLNIYSFEISEAESGLDYKLSGE
jgi:hypothetical protein